MQELNADNIVSKVSRVSLVTRVGSKTGQPYTVLTVQFVNGLSIDNFVDKRDLFGLQNVLEAKSADKPLDLVD